MQTWQKILIALILSVLIIGGSYSIFSWFTNPTFQSRVRLFAGIKVDPTNSNSNKNTFETPELVNQLKQANLTKDYYRDYSLLDLNIYPSAWVKRHFNEAEQKNALVSGKDADPRQSGLSNQQKYLYGADPKKKNSLCDGKAAGSKPVDGSDYACDDKTDKDLVAVGISPLTGLQLDIPKTFRALNQDVQVLNNLKDGIEKASDDALDYSDLYNASRSVSFDEDLNKLPTTQVDDTSQARISYQNVRLNILKNFVGADNGAVGIGQIYQISTPEQFNALKNIYKQNIDKLSSAGVPRPYTTSNKAYIFILQKLTELIDIRQTALAQKTTETEPYKQTIQKKAVEVVWGYRRLSEELAKVEK